MRQVVKRFGLWIGMIGMILLIALDQITKSLAVSHLKNAPAIPLIPGVFELSYLENQGAAFGILQGQKTFFVVLTITALIILFFLYVRIPRETHYGYLRLLLVLFISGAVGNFIDRCMHDYVIDFFYFSLINFPVFNVADIYVTMAAVFMIVLFCFYYKEEDIDMLLGQLMFWKKREKNVDGNRSI
ncbi:MAG: signal peptidase II [Lachnospiraceae bacterium]|nr:signal peptidase II [Lachnospiraceae bacterium]